MFERVLHFVKYNNAFTIGFVLVFFSFGVTYAANPDVREAVYSSEETVLSVDNRSIVAADLDSFNPNLRILSVAEDDGNYYAAYVYRTLSVEDGIWQEKETEKTLTVSKEALGGKDLGLYVAKELGENIRYELSYLKRAQKLEKEKGESKKVVTVEYSGLVGKFLDPKKKTIEGYSPVIPEIVKEVSSPATNPAAVIVSVPSKSEKDKNSAAASGGVDETLVQEVVEELLEDDGATSTPETVPAESSDEPAGEIATSTPSSEESAPESAATSTPQPAAPVPEPAVTVTPETESPPSETATSSETASEPAQ